MNKYQKGFAPILVIGLVVLVLAMIAGIGYAIFINGQSSNQSVKQEATYSKIFFEKNNNSEKGDKSSSSYWDRKVLGINQNNKTVVIADSIVESFNLELKGEPIVFTFVPKNQTAYFHSAIDGTMMISKCYSLDIATLTVKKLNYDCFNDYTSNYVISPDGSKIAYAFSYGEIKVVDITNGYIKSLVKAESGEVLYKKENVGFKWIDDNILQYPIYNKKLELISIKKIKVDISDITTSIEFLSPKTGDKLFIGSTYDIKWTANGLDDIKVLEILSGDFSNEGAGYRPSFIGKGYPVVNVSEGNYRVTIPESPLFPIESGYRVYIKTDNTEAYSDVFSIVDPSK